jgi:hypothetical protein
MCASVADIEFETAVFRVRGTTSYARIWNSVVSEVTYQTEVRDDANGVVPWRAVQGPLPQYQPVCWGPARI